MSIPTKRFLYRLARTAGAAAGAAAVGAILAAGASTDTPATIAVIIGFGTPLLAAAEVWFRSRAAGE